jgi:hypothetical protein
MASVAGPRPPCGVHSAVPSSGSGVQPSGVRAVWCPVRPVSSASGVHRPASSRLLSASVRPDASISFTSGGGGGDQLEAAGNRHHKNGSSPGGLPRLGAARCTAEQARTWAMLPRSVGQGGRWRTRARWAAGAAAVDRLSDQAGQAGVWSAVANGCAVGSGAGRSARLPQRPCGCRRGLGGDHGGWWSWGLPPGWAGLEGPVGVPAGMGVRPQRGPGWQRALPARCRQRCDLRGGWWACQDLNLGPHPYQQSSTERHADRCFPW